MESLTRSSLPLVSLDTSPPLRASSLQEGSYEVIDGVSHPRGVTPTSYEPWKGRGVRTKSAVNEGQYLRTQNVVDVISHQEKKQINELMGRSRKIWIKNKKRLTLVLSGSVEIKNNLNSSCKDGSPGGILDYWDTKKKSKSFSLSWKNRKISLKVPKDSMSNLQTGLKINEGISETLYNSKNFVHLIRKSEKKTKLSLGTPNLFSPKKQLPLLK